MSDRVKTFWCEPTGRARVMLTTIETRECGDSKALCSGRIVVHEDWDAAESFPFPPADDPRWPTHCDRCGRAFTDEATHSTASPRLYRGAPDGRLYTLSEMPAGAMWDADWMRDTDHCRSPDGITLVVKLPNRLDWMPDGPAANSTSLPGWTRTGDPRKANVTATPSIGSPWPPSSPNYYHGWLRDGFLVPA